MYVCYACIYFEYLCGRLTYISCLYTPWLLKRVFDFDCAKEYNNNLWNFCGRSGVCRFMLVLAMNFLVNCVGPEQIMYNCVSWNSLVSEDKFINRVRFPPLTIVHHAYKLLRVNGRFIVCRMLTQYKYAFIGASMNSCSRWNLPRFAVNWFRLADEPLWMCFYPGSWWIHLGARPDRIYICIYLRSRWIYLRRIPFVMMACDKF